MQVITPLYECPDCHAQRLQYRINYDLYVCPDCGHGFTVESTEKTHVSYDGGPPKRVEFV